MEIQTAATQIQPQTLEEKLIAFSSMAYDLENNHRDELYECGMDIENISANICIGINNYNEHQNDLEHAGDDTPAQTQAWAMKGERV